MRKAFLALALLCMTAPARADVVNYQAYTDVPVPAAGQIQETFIAASPAELLTSVSAPTYGLYAPRNIVRVMHVKIEDVQPGDVITAQGIFEVTSEHSLTEVSSGMILTSDSTGTAGVTDVSGDQFCFGCGENPTSGVWITRFPGRNLPLNVHHDFYTHAGSVVVPSGMSGDVYAAIIMYADAGASSSRYVTIEQYAGSMSATITRN